MLKSEDLVNTGYRRQQLKWFHKMLFEGKLDEYKLQVLNSPGAKDEATWQHFFEKNQWIFGYGLCYRFQSILQREFHASDTTAAGKEAVISDFLLGDQQFTTFVELKKPDTPMFGNSKNRSGCWKLSEELQDAVSQIIEQKAAGELKLATSSNLYDEYGDLITQKPYDSKVILLVGCWRQLEDCGASEQEKMIKRKTFERYRRQLKDVEILTYNELFERARYIVEYQSGK